MNTESRSFYLLSQVFFAGLSALPWLFFAVLAVFGFTINPFYSLFILSYGVLALLLIWNWIKYRNSQSVPKSWNLVSIALWTVPTIYSIYWVVLVLIAEFDDKPDTFNDVEYSPVAYLPLVILAVIWFGSPLILSVLHFLDVDLCKKTEQDAAANP